MARLIDAEALYSELRKAFAWKDLSEEQITIYEAIEAAPTVDAEPVRRGKWTQDDTWKDLYFCSACIGRDHRNKPKHKYCPDCGSRMDEVSE